MNYRYNLYAKNDIHATLCWTVRLLNDIVPSYYGIARLYQAFAGTTFVGGGCRYLGRRTPERSPRIGSGADGKSAASPQY